MMIVDTSRLKSAEALIIMKASTTSRRDNGLSCASQLQLADAKQKVASHANPFMNFLIFVHVFEEEIR